MAVASVTTDQILQAYRDTLGRTPGPEEVNFWVNYSTTNDPTQTANAFLAGAQDELASRQSINIPAATSSDLVLNLPTRTTIPAPVDVSSLAATGPVRPVPQPSVTSDQIVESYTKYLNRTPSAEEITFWTDYSKTNDPTQTAEAFLAGAKNEIANVTKSGYESYLGRTPNQEELNFWTNYTVEQGAPQAAAAWRAGADQELAARNVPSSVTEQQILDSYNKFFNRTPSADEVSFWVNYGRTADPTQTANAFINSARKEIGDITKSGYESYLGREPTQQELDFWTNYTIENDAVQAANAWKAGADEELIRRKAAVDVDTTLQNSNLTGSLVSESTAGIPYAGGIYKRTPQEEVMYLKELSRIPVNAAVPLPVMPMSLGPSDALTRARQPGDIGEGAYYAAIRDVVTSGDYTPAQLRQMQRNVGTSGQDINVAFGRGMTPITTTTPTMPGATTGTTQSIDQFIQSKAPTTSVAMPTAPSMFSPENVRAQLELERLRLQPTPEPPPEEPVAGFAQGGLVSDDINRMLQNQRNAIQRESQSRQMLTNLGAPPVKKFSDGGPAGSSSGVRRLKMSG
jgi:type III secretory pathway component EscR